tara:strand:+ start:4652 stop:6046 length:1395 start_codon:yes stop_codon:yes gene_type:complete
MEIYKFSWHWLLMNFFIPFEIKNRDYLSRLLVAYYAAEKGYDVCLGSKSQIDTLVKTSKAGIYLGLVTTKTYSKFYKKLKENNFKIFVIDEEGLITFDDKMYIDLKVSEDALINIENLFTWGEEHKKIILTKFPKFKKKVISTGTPRFDLFQSKYRNIFEINVSKIIKKYNDFTLICGSFSFVNHFTKDLNYLNVLKSQKVIKNIDDENKFLKYCKYNKESFENFIELTIKLSKKFKDHKFIYRPHPAENAQIYKEKFVNLKNVFIEKDFTLIEWIIASRCLIHSYCTSSIEALLVDKTRFALKENFDPEVHKTIPYEFSDTSKSIDEMIEKYTLFLNNSLNYKYTKNNCKLRLNKYVSNDDNYISSEKIIDQIFSLYPPQQDKSNKKFDFFIFNLLYYFRLIKRYFYNFKDNYKKHNKYIDHKIGNISLSEINYHLTFFKKKNSLLNVKKIKKNLFLLKKNKI